MHFIFVPFKSRRKLFKCHSTHNDSNCNIWQGELKQKEAALEIATHSFVQKENDLFNRIEELEKSMEEISQNNSSASETNIQKVSYFLSSTIFWQNDFMKWS